MATSIADLLDALSSQADHSADRVDSTDADHALALLGRVLQRTVDDGLTPLDRTDTEREHWVGEAARACAQSAADAETAAPGQLSHVAGAVADVATMQREDLGCQNRWAIAIAVTDVVSRLTALIDPADVPIERRRALIVADASATVIQRSAALDPPSARHAAALDRAVPQPFPDGIDSPGTAIREAAAGLERATRPGPSPMMIAEYLSVAIAVERLFRSVPAVMDSRDPGIPTAAQRASDGWAAARAVLKPFDDGSRRPHDVAPPAVSFALALHDGLRRAQAQRAERRGFHPVADPIDGAVRDALQRVPTIADNLNTALTVWGDTGRVVAFARDLQFHDWRLDAYLAEYTPAGLVAGDVTDLTPARNALAGARLLSVDLAARAAAPDHPGLTTAHLAAANQHDRAHVDGDRLHAATMEARRALQVYAGPPRAARGPRR